MLNVALLAEGVDRNNKARGTTYTSAESPSSRRAWIEIDVVYDEFIPERVALLAEGVDRNNTEHHWKMNYTQVALLAEGVDRNYFSHKVLEVFP